MFTLLVTLFGVALSQEEFNFIEEFTGDVPRDFEGKSRVYKLPDSDNEPDVGVPDQLGEGVVSGWDIDNIWFQYNHMWVSFWDSSDGLSDDELNVGVDCFEICGDADTIDHNPDTTSPELAQIGGLVR